MPETTKKNLLTITIRRAGRVSVIVPRGEIRRESTRLLEKGLDKTLAGDGVEVVILSMRFTTSLLSDGIRSLVGLRDRALDEGKEFHITDLPREIHYALKITNLLPFLHYTPSLKDILAKENPAGKKGDVQNMDVRKDEVDPTAPKRDRTSRRMAKPESAKLETDATLTAISEKSEAAGAIQAAGTASTVRANMSTEEIREIVEHAVPGRLAAEVLEYFLRHGDSAAVDFPTLRKATNAGEKELRPVVKRLLHTNILRSMGADVYNYGPDEDWNEKIQTFLRLWRRPGHRGRILTALIASETS